jgi:nicotinate-nucleotide pyrophosphorylase (carboxylating)
MMAMQREVVERAISAALREDVGLGDITTDSTVPVAAVGLGRLWAKQPQVVAGLAVAEAVFAAVDSSLQWEPAASDGDVLAHGAPIAHVRGSLRAILTAERTALNFLQRMGGIATLTRQFVEALEGTGVRVADTRKTTPGLRMLEKHAVAVAGGVNHRWALDSGVLIKDNHLLAAGGVGPAVASAREGAPHTLRVEVECKRLDQVAEAIEAGAEAVLLDNMGGALLAEAVALASGRVVVEVSGGVTLETIREKALPGVDLISVGALTHSAPCVDIALDLEGGVE